MSFKGELNETPNRVVLENFKVGFKRTYCDHIKINGDKELIVKNGFFRFGILLDLWIGIGFARVTIDKSEPETNRIIEYSIDYTRLTLSYIFFLISFLLFCIISGLWVIQFLKFLVFSGIYSVIIHLVTFLRHRSIFNQILNYETYNIGNYDWCAIMKSKTDKELVGIINGNRQLPDNVIKFAELEIENRRKSKFKNQEK